MVTPIKRFKKDPNGLGRGDGIYYHRGNGYYSQYSRTRDANKKSKGYETDKVGVPVKARFPHVTDGLISKYWTRHPQWFGGKKKVKT